VRIRLESIGCRLNAGEIEAIGRRLADDGHRIVGPEETADVCIFNSCTVTSIASRKSRQMLRQLRRSNPGCTMVATGCYTELAADEARALGVDLVVGNLDKDRLPDLLAEHEVLVPAEPADHVAAAAGRTRAFLKVQDGCDNRCTFCVVTLARGGGRSRAADHAVAEVRALERIGYREVVLSGVHLGSYGHDLGDQRGLERLVERILAETGVERLRLSSLEPWDLEPGFFELFGNPRLLPHLHVPLQSGCNATLRRMGRRTDRARFRALVAAARAAIPRVSISTDIMVGFPGETDDEFERSLGFVEEIEFSRLHVFRFSPRPGTAAATMGGQVAGEVAQRRSRRMLAVGALLEARFLDRHAGTTAPVLWEEAEEAGSGLRWSGLTDTYLRTVTETGPELDLANRITDTRLVRAVPGGMLGEVIR
jgi:threonylcarbamoyladenosine tRNA methylthiotransferase MtaB